MYIRTYVRTCIVIFQESKCTYLFHPHPSPSHISTIQTHTYNVCTYVHTNIRTLYLLYVHTYVCMYVHMCSYVHLLLILCVSPQYDKVGKLTRDFEPYKNLWNTAADWGRYHETWMNDALVNIDPDIMA